MSEEVASDSNLKIYFETTHHSLHSLPLFLTTAFVVKASTNRARETPGKMTNTKDKAISSVHFVSRDIVQKKKNPQQKLERYFALTKSKGQKVEKNFQGFPLNECRYEEEIDKCVYCPPGYPGEKQAETFLRGEKLTDQKLCHDCLLRPCIAKGRRNDIIGFCEEIMVFESDDTSDSMWAKMIEHAETIVAGVFGSRHVRNHAPPSCVHEMVRSYVAFKSGMEEEEEENPDHELVARSVDGADFATPELALPAAGNGV